jgi:ribonuclease D
VILHKNDLPPNLKFVDSIAVDTETMGLSLKRDRLCLVQLCSSDGTVHMVQIQKERENEAENLKKLLADRSLLKIFHYARFDLAVLKHAFHVAVGPVYCTKIASKLSRTYTDKHGLKDICWEILKVEISKNEQSSDWGREELSSEQLKYAAGDVLYLHKLKEKLDEILRREGKMAIAQKCFDALDLISDLELMGVSPRELFSH